MPTVKDLIGVNYYAYIHQKLRANHKKPDRCQKCNTDNFLRLEWANITGVYNEDIKNYMALCVPCHRRMDYRPRPCSEKTVCVNGHKLTKENLITRKDKATECRTCVVESKKNYNDKRTESRYRAKLKIMDRENLIEIIVNSWKSTKLNLDGTRTYQKKAKGRKK